MAKRQQRLVDEATLLDPVPPHITTHHQTSSHHTHPVQFLETVTVSQSHNTSPHHTTPHQFIFLETPTQNHAMTKTSAITK